MFYEQLKSLFVTYNVTLYKKYNQGANSESKSSKTQNVDITFYQSMICSWIGGGAASVITNPLDLAKLRLQV